MRAKNSVPSMERSIDWPVSCNGLIEADTKLDGRLVSYLVTYANNIVHMFGQCLGKSSGITRVYDDTFNLFRQSYELNKGVFIDKKRIPGIIFGTQAAINLTVTRKMNDPGFVANHILTDVSDPDRKGRDKLVAVAKFTTLQRLAYVPNLLIQSQAHRIPGVRG